MIIMIKEYSNANYEVSSTIIGAYETYERAFFTLHTMAEKKKKTHQEVCFYPEDGELYLSGVNRDDMHYSVHIKMLVIPEINKEVKVNIVDKHYVD